MNIVNLHIYGHVSNGFGCFYDACMPLLAIMVTIESHCSRSKERARVHCRHLPPGEMGAMGMPYLCFSSLVVAEIHYFFTKEQCKDHLSSLVIGGLGAHWLTLKSQI